MDRRIAFPILGRSFQAAGVTPEVGEWLESRWHFPEHDLPPHPHRIHLRLLPPAPRSPGAPPFEPAGEGLGWRARGGAWETTGDVTGLRVRHRKGASRLVARRMEGSARALAAWHYALYVAISHALWASGLVPVHAAAIVEDGGVTVLLGIGGTGKSTTLLQAARAGRALLAEDSTWLDPATLRIHGWDRGLRIAAATLRRFAPDLAGREWARDARGKLIVPYESLGAPRVPAGVLKRVVLLERDLTRPSGWEPLHPRDAVRALWESTGIPLAAHERPILSRVISEVVTRVELRRLRLGNTPLRL